VKRCRLPSGFGKPIGFSTQVRALALLPSSVTTELLMKCTVIGNAASAFSSQPRTLG